MSISIRPGARLLFRVDPLPRESPRGYLCRVAHEHGYCGPLSLVQIAELQTSGLERDDTAKQISHVLRLETEEWVAMCYRHIKGRNRFDQRSFYGERVSGDDLNYKRPRICPRCLEECPVLVGCLGPWPRHNMRSPPLSSRQSVSGLRKEAGLAASGCSQMPLRVLSWDPNPGNSRPRSGSDQCSNL